LCRVGDFDYGGALWISHCVGVSDDDFEDVVFDHPYFESFVAHFVTHPIDFQPGGPGWGENVKQNKRRVIASARDCADCATFLDLTGQFPASEVNIV